MRQVLDAVTPRGAVAAVAMALRQQGEARAADAVLVAVPPPLLPVRCCLLIAVWQRR